MSDIPYGERHVLDVFEQKAAQKPEQVFISIPNSTTDPSAGWRDVTYTLAANAVNRTAHYLLKVMGRKSTSSETIVYIGPNDARYIAMMLASMKTGFQVLFVSPRNSLAGQKALFAESKSLALFYAPEYQDILAPVFEAIDFPSHQVPSLEEWFDPTPVEPIPFESGPKEKWQFEPAVVLHTSGSTGIPKMVIERHGLLAAADYGHALESKTGRPLFIPEIFGKGYRILASMPIFHAGGTFSVLIFGILTGSIMTYLPAGQPMTTESILAALEYSGVDAAIIAPSIVAELSEDPEALKKLARLKYILTGGGPTSPETAERIRAAGVYGVNMVGASEVIVHKLATTADEFPYFRIDEELAGIDWHPVENAEGKDLRELWLKRQPDSRHIGCFYTFPDLDEYNMRDIYEKVPGRPGLWQYYARSDDVIVFENGEKLNPVDIEGSVTAHPRVKGAVVVGQARFQPALLVEPVQPLQSKEERQHFIDEIWPLVDEINAHSVAHGQVLKSFIRVTDPDRPFPRAGKGTIQRAGANLLYKAEINEIYAQAGKQDDQKPLELRLQSEDDLAACILEAFRANLQEQISARLTLDTDIFSVGVDSMQVLTISRALKRALDAQKVSIDPKAITPRAIYANSTPRRIAHALWGQIGASNGISTNGTSFSETPNGVTDEDDPEALVKEFTADLPTVTRSEKQHSGSETYLITGTTGALGPYLLQCALRDKTAHIFAFNRDPAAAKRQAQAHTERALDTNLDRVTFLTVDYGAPDFGLDPAAFARVRDTTTRIIHNAWPVNFNIPVRSFLSSIAGVRHLVDLAADAPHHPHITFVSTIGTTALHPSPIPETPLPLSAAYMGYGQSKSVSSAILDAAREKGVESAIVRSGQIAGPLSAAGQWNTKEWFPTLVKSSIGMGLLPDQLGNMGGGRVDWLPVEAVAGTVFDVSVAHASGYYHAVNPTGVSWASLLPVLQAHYSDRGLKTVSLAEWVEELEKRGRNVTDEAVIEKIPAIKLVEFFKGTLQPGEVRVYETARTEEVSEMLRTVGPVKPEWLKTWLQQWHF